MPGFLPPNVLAGMKSATSPFASPAFLASDLVATPSFLVSGLVLLGFSPFADLVASARCLPFFDSASAGFSHWLDFTSVAPGSDPFSFVSACIFLFLFPTTKPCTLAKPLSVESRCLFAGHFSTTERGLAESASASGVEGSSSK
eukprot:CAMPEP_0117524754 /NCGR_PEP_ID=MMETSP0784-20121206/35413_1 /TAXON_ID=39447 /ORGANISM="" /LENGTH=143 /DNA_ID=CAMNT_0005320921 /DNA_START=483 /DNA_END=914 /DNA_ORIENTATION=-